MTEFKLKLIVTILSGIVFSFIFILLTFILPTKSEQVIIQKKSDGGRLEQIAKHAK